MKNKIDSENRKTNNISLMQGPGKQLQEQEAQLGLKVAKMKATTVTLSSNFIHGKYPQDSVRAYIL